MRTIIVTAGIMVAGMLALAGCGGGEQPVQPKGEKETAQTATPPAETAVPTAEPVTPPETAEEPVASATAPRRPPMPGEKPRWQQLQLSSDVKALPEDPSALVKRITEDITENRTGDFKDLVTEYPDIVNLKSEEDGRTPTHEAAARGKKALLQLLVMTPGVDLNTKDNDGNTPLSVAVIEGNLDAVAMLVDYWSDIEATNNDGYTPLAEAASNNRPDVAKFLIERGADITKQTKDGMTPVMVATWTENAAVLKVLIDAGADVNTKDKEGRSPLDVAMKNANTDVQKLLKDAGAVTSTPDR